MSDQLKIKVTRRTDFGKGAARQARRAGLIPAVVYGHGQDPVHLLLPAQETTLAVRNPNALLTVVNEASSCCGMAIGCTQVVLKTSAPLKSG